jgi:negative regulator of replication initiation
MLELLVDTAEQYQRELECDRELYQVIALDAKGIPESRITASRAVRLLEEASKIAKKVSPA